MQLGAWKQQQLDFRCVHMNTYTICIYYLYAIYICVHMYAYIYICVCVCHFRCTQLCFVHPAEHELQFFPVFPSVSQCFWIFQMVRFGVSPVILCAAFPKLQRGIASPIFCADLYHLGPRLAKQDATTGQTLHSSPSAADFRGRYCRGGGQSWMMNRM